MKNEAIFTTPVSVAQAPAILPPLAAKLDRLALVLGEKSHTMSVEDWSFLRLVRLNLLAVAAQVAAMENHFEVPHEIS